MHDTTPLALLQPLTGLHLAGRSGEATHTGTLHIPLPRRAAATFDDPSLALVWHALPAPVGLHPLTSYYWGEPLLGVTHPGGASVLLGHFTLDGVPLRPRPVEHWFALFAERFYAMQFAQDGSDGEPLVIHTEATEGMNCTALLRAFGSPEALATASLADPPGRDPIATHDGCSVAWGREGRNVYVLDVTQEHQTTWTGPTGHVVDVEVQMTDRFRLDLAAKTVNAEHEHMLREL